MISFQLQKALHAADGTMLLEINGNFQAGQIIALYGSSGAGKSSVLNMLAGLMTPDAGIISLGEQHWFHKKEKINLSPQQRSLGYVFQNYSLFPNMTVRQNLSYALNKGQSNTIIEELLDMVELRALQYQKPALLSGGQQQRVALARALVRQPRLLLLDEPLSALDHRIRQKLQDYILKLQAIFQPITFLVSHDVAEVCRMADQVILLEKGKVLEQGSPKTIFGSASEEKAIIVEILTILENSLVEVLLENEVVQMQLSEEEITSLKVGDRVWLERMYRLTN